MARSQKEAERLYMKGGLAAVYPDVYGENGIFRQAGREDWPIDRFKPKKGFKPFHNPPYTGWDQFKKDR